ncbi:MAG TPA: hypothetical protein PKL29_08150 [Methanothrix sp.]|jgi:hypothetical protein|nr:hypothetical protein [Methanothrix sp.]HPT37740.1 hypothetical protein [Methanothrix sp.]
MAKKEKKAGNKQDSRLAPTENDKPVERIVKQQPKVKPMSAAERRKNRIDGIIKTVYPAVLGTIAGFVCYHTGESLAPYPWHFVMMSLILVTFIIQKYTYSFMNIDAASFKAKDWFYVEFMVIDLWLVSWTLLLN